MDSLSRSKWARFLFIITFIETAILIAYMIVFFVSLGRIRDINTISGNVFGAYVALSVITFALTILEIAGGFLLSLKGKWGPFVIVMSILSVLTSASSFFALVRTGSAANIVLAALDLVLSILIVVAAFKVEALGKVED